uniref:Uncharacterized protein n=1 Tax=Amphimedon queenslandica TaxID=400682 RepID=A0A1X7SD69_AMPQE
IEELEEENNQNKIGDQLHDDVSLTDFLRDEPSLAELFDPSKQWDIFNQEETTTNLDEQQQELVQHEVTEQSSFKTKQSNIYTSDHNEANSLNTVSAIGDLNMAVSHIVPYDVLLPLPSPLEEYKTLSLHSPEVE